MAALLDYDGKGATVGDVAVSAATTDYVDTSVYAFTHSDDPGKMELVALNKTTVAVPVHLSLATSAPLTGAKLYHLAKSAAVAVTAVGGQAPAVVCGSGVCSLDYTLEPLSVTTIVLR